MNNKSIQDRFRRQLTGVHALTVLIVSIIELIGYVILVVSDNETFSIKNFYLWYRVILPITANVITHLVARIFLGNPKVDRRKKNRVIITATLVTSLIVALVHKEYIVTSCAFIFPMILSAMFNEEKLLNTSFLASIMILMCVGVAFAIDGGITLTIALNLVILFGFAFVSYFCGIISISFSAHNHTAIELQMKRNNRLLDTVLRDQMTGLFNHHSFVNRLGKILRSFDEEESICLAMLDIDDFKCVNDTYGHDCGDKVLVYLASTIKKYSSKYDSAYRYGGEEFAIIFIGKDPGDVCDIVQNILEDFRSYRFPFADRPITFSAGVAVYTNDLSQNEFFEKSDQTLYLAKKKGKNTVIKAEENCHIA